MINQMETLENSTNTSFRSRYVNDQLLSDGGHLAMGFILTTSSLMGTLINGLVVFTFVRNQKLRTPTNWTILGLVISDFFMAFLATPMVAISSFSRRWVFGVAGCQYYGFVVSLMGYISIAMLTMVSLTRYLVTVKTHMKHIITNSAMLKLVCCVFVYSFICAVCPLLGWSSYGLEGANTSCSVEWNKTDASHISYNLFIMMMQFILPLVAIVSCYSSIFNKLRNDSLNRRWRLTRRSWTRRTKMDRRISITIILMIIAFVASWFPYSAVSLWAIFGDANAIPIAVKVIPAVMAKMYVIWNPVIYIARNKQLRAAIYSNTLCSRMIVRILYSRASTAIQAREDTQRGDQATTDLRFVDDSRSPRSGSFIIRELFSSRSVHTSTRDDTIAFGDDFEELAKTELENPAANISEPQVCPPDIAECITDKNDQQGIEVTSL